jgi:hypothetical protein
VTGATEHHASTIARTLTTQAERQITTAASELWPQDARRVGPLISGGSHVVRRVDVGSEIIFATYSLLGAPLTSLLRGTWPDEAALLAAQRGYIATHRGPLLREAEQLDLLAVYSRLQVCQPVGWRAGVLFTSGVKAAPDLNHRLLADPRSAADPLSELFAELAELHTDAAEPLRQSPRRFPNGMVTPQLGDTFNSHPGRWLADIDTSWADTEQTEHLHALGLRLMGRLGRLAHRYDATFKSAGGVSFGLTPEHVLYPARGSGPVLVSPDLGDGGDITDVGKLLGRLHLLLSGTQLTATTTAEILSGVEMWMCGQISTHRHDVWQPWLGAVLTRWAADVVHILAAHLPIRAGLIPLSPVVTAAAHRPLETLAVLDSFTAVLLHKSPETAFGAALAALMTCGARTQPTESRKIERNHSGPRAA